MTTHTKTKHECGNCDWVGTNPNYKDGNIPHLWERTDPDSPDPSGECPKCGALCYEQEEENEISPTCGPDLIDALEDIELSATQARIASTIGKKSGKADFLRNELARIVSVAREAIAEARGTPISAPSHPAIEVTEELTEAWREEVTAGNTVRGLTDWIAAQAEQESEVAK